MEITNSTVAVVTGGASGLGEATATALAEKGAKVVIFDMNEELGPEVAKQIGGDFIRVNVADVENVTAAIAEVKAKHGGLHVLINCAGIGTPGKTVSKGIPLDAKAYQTVINVNLIGSMNMAVQGAAVMVANDPINADGERGVIINTASVAAFDGQIGQIAYSASKGGIVGMTLPMARDLSRDGVRVCTIAPGLFLTPLMKSLPEEAQESLGKQVPFPSRLGHPSEYAHMACHIVENIMLNGEVIRLDGAIRMAPR